MAAVAAASLLALDLDSDKWPLHASERGAQTPATEPQSMATVGAEPLARLSPGVDGAWEPARSALGGREPGSEADRGTPLLALPSRLLFPCAYCESNTNSTWGRGGEGAELRGL